MAEIRRALFPRYSRSHVRLYNLATTRRLVLALEIAGERLTLSLGPAPGTVQALQSLALTAGPGNGWLNLDPLLFDRLCQPWTGGESLDVLPPPLRNAARQTALAPLLDALETTLGLTVDPAETPPPSSATIAVLGLWLAVRPEGRPNAVLRLDDAAAATLSARLECCPPVADQEIGSKLPIDLTLWVGQTRLRAREVRQLEPADILLLSALAPGTAPELILRQRQPLAMARMNGRQLLIDRLVETPMSEHASANAADSPKAPIDPDELEIRIDFDLGHLTLPLGELRAIQPGYSFELDLPAPDQVRILAGSRVIGHGELIRIDDRLGVRVTALFKSPA